jgi:hypothetical protein
MNTVAGAMLLLWLAGWTAAMVRAGLKTEAVVAVRPSWERLPGKSAAGE